MAQSTGSSCGALGCSFRYFLPSDSSRIFQIIDVKISCSLCTTSGTSKSLSAQNNVCSTLRWSHFHSACLYVSSCSKLTFPNFTAHNTCSGWLPKLWRQVRLHSGVIKTQTYTMFYTWVKLNNAEVPKLLITSHSNVWNGSAFNAAAAALSIVPSSLFTREPFPNTFKIFCNQRTWLHPIDEKYKASNKVVGFNRTPNSLRTGESSTSRTLSSLFCLYVELYDMLLAFVFVAVCLHNISNMTGFWVSCIEFKSTFMMVKGCLEILFNGFNLSDDVSPSSKAIRAIAAHFDKDTEIIFSHKRSDKYKYLRSTRNGALLQIELSSLLLCQILSNVSLKASPIQRTRGE